MLMLLKADVRRPELRAGQIPAGTGLAPEAESQQFNDSKGSSAPQPDSINAAAD